MGWRQGGLGRNIGGQPNDVSNCPNGQSWVGALHLSGNVWEWCSTLYQSYPYVETDGRENLTVNGDRVRRGGLWYVSSDYLRASTRLCGFPYDDYAGFGFRCARS